jgi:hypothetical protein
LKDYVEPLPEFWQNKDNFIEAEIMAKLMDEHNMSAQEVQEAFPLDFKTIQNKEALFSFATKLKELLYTASIHFIADLTEDNIGIKDGELIIFDGRHETSNWVDNTTHWLKDIRKTTPGTYKKQPNPNQLSLDI